MCIAESADAESQVASMGARLLRRLNAYEQVVRFSIAATQLVAAQATGGESTADLLCS